MSRKITITDEVFHEDCINDEGEILPMKEIKVTYFDHSTDGYIYFEYDGVKLNIEASQLESLLRAVGLDATIRAPKSDL